MRKLLIWIMAGGLLAGCATPPAQVAEPPAYFDLKAFLNEQRDYLESVNPAVTRTVAAGAAPAETQHLQRVNWEQELAFFYQADLNKPALRGAYSVQRQALPDGGTRTRYERRSGTDAPVRWLEVETAPGGQLAALAALQEQHNMLFTSDRRLRLRCDPDPEHNRLLEYEIKGSQKLVFFDPARYSVRAEVE